MSLIRPAVAYDAAGFSLLWETLIRDSRSFLLPTARTLRFGDHLFHSYTTGELPGVIGILDVDGACRGMVVWGAASKDDLPYDTSLGRTAIAWGTVVEETFREKGHSLALHKWAEEQLRALGFNAVLGTVFRRNPAAFYSVEAAGFSIGPTEVYKLL